MATDPFVLLNQAVAEEFGSRTPIAYYPSSGPLIGTTVTVRAVIDDPLNADYGAQRVVWIDLNESVMTGILPKAGDRMVTQDGTIYTVNLVNPDAEKGIQLVCRRSDR